MGDFVQHLVHVQRRGHHLIQAGQGVEGRMGRRRVIAVQLSCFGQRDLRLGCNRQEASVQG